MLWNDCFGRRLPPYGTQILSCWKSIRWIILPPYPSYPFMSCLHDTVDLVVRHGSWRDASEGLQSAAWWLDSPIYRPMAKPKQGFIGWNKSLGARCRFFVEFWHFGLRRLWMSPDAILPHLTSDQTLRCENAWHFITHVLVYMTPSQYLTHPHAYQAVNTYWKR